MGPSADVPLIGASGRPPSRGIPVALVIVLAIAAIGIAAGWLIVRRGPTQPPAPVLTDEARAYIRAGSLKLADVEMNAKESFARQMLVEVTGKITNDGERPIRFVRITCIFRDPSGNVILREPSLIVNAKMGGLMRGETKSFRLPFDAIPESWNQALPDLVIAEIVFG